MNKLNLTNKEFSILEATNYVSEQIHVSDLSNSDLIDAAFEGKLIFSLRFETACFFLAKVTTAHFDEGVDYGQLLHAPDTRLASTGFINPIVTKHFETDLFEGTSSQKNFNLCLTLGSEEFLRKFKRNDYSPRDITVSKPLYFERNGEYFVLTKLPQNILTNEKFVLCGDTDELDESDYIAYNIGDEAILSITKANLDNFILTITTQNTEQKSNSNKVTKNIEREKVIEIITALVSLVSSKSNLGLSENQIKNFIRINEKYLVSDNRDSIYAVIQSLMPIAKLPQDKPESAASTLTKHAELNGIDLPSQSTIVKWLKTH